MNPILPKFEYILAFCVVFLLFVMYLFYVKYAVNKIKDDD